MSEGERREHIGLEVATHEIHRNFGDRAALCDAGVVDENIEGETEGMLDIEGIEKVQLLDTQVRDLVRLHFGAQRGHLGPALGCRDDLMSLTGESNPTSS